MFNLRNRALEAVASYFSKLPEEITSSDLDLDAFARLVLSLPQRPSKDRCYSWLLPTDNKSTILRHPLSDLITSQAGIDLIKRFEGFRAKAYICPGGVWTIGYGHTGRVKPGDIVTQKEAEIQLRSDLVKFEHAVRKHTKVNLTQHEFDALVSFTYNVGEGAFSKSGLLRLLNAGDYEGCSEQFDRWVYANKLPLEGLRRRRAAEKALFLGQA